MERKNSFKKLEEVLLLEEHYEGAMKFRRWGKVKELVLDNKKIVLYRQVRTRQVHTLEGSAYKYYGIVFGYKESNAYCKMFENGRPLGMYGEGISAIKIVRIPKNEQEEIRIRSLSLLKGPINFWDI